MARLTNWLSTLHAFLTALPQNGYHNISRVIQPQMRSISESLLARPGPARGRRGKVEGIEMQSLRSRGKAGSSVNRREGSVSA
jgi:hypothetical protein